MMQTFTGIEYLKIDIANNFGYDKNDWDERIEWFNCNEQKLEGLLKNAEEPALYFAAVKAFRNSHSGKPNHYPISLDATSSGIQIFAALTCDRKAASLCNVIDTGHREDAYTSLYQVMLDLLGGTASIKRADTKQAVMTSFYGSEAVPKYVFGQGEMLDIFFHTMENEAPLAWELNQTMLALWNPEAYVNEWIMPDNFHVKVKVMNSVIDRIHFLNSPYDITYSVNEPMEKGRSLGANLAHSVDGMIVREMTRRCGYNLNRILWVKSHFKDEKYLWSYDQKDDEIVSALAENFKCTGFLSARILDHINPKNEYLINWNHIRDLCDTLPLTPFKVLSVHDCFRCLPNYGNDLRKQYNQILSDIAKSEILTDLLEQMTGRTLKIRKGDPNLWKEILDSNYALS